MQRSPVLYRQCFSNNLNARKRPEIHIGLRHQCGYATSAPGQRTIITNRAAHSLQSCNIGHAKSLGRIGRQKVTTSQTSRLVSTFTFAVPQDASSSVPSRPSTFENAAVARSPSSGVESIESSETSQPLSVNARNDPIPSNAPGPIPDPAPAPEAFIPTDSLGDLIASESTPGVDEHVGFLRELGLDYGWGFTSSIQWLLEHVYLYTGLPWWQSIIFTSLLVRLGMMKLGMDASDMSARMAALKPSLEPITRRMSEARASGDRAKVMEANQMRVKAMQDTGVKFSKTLLPLIQIPLGFGTFRLLRGMSSLPVPSLENGGGLWFVDLTEPDPTYLLALASSGIMYLTFMRTVKEGSITAFAPSTVKMFGTGISIVSGLFAAFMPACLQLSILTTTVFSAIQTNLFRSPSFRNFFGMYPFPGKNVNPTPQLPVASPQRQKVKPTPKQPVASPQLTSSRKTVSGASVVKELTSRMSPATAHRASSTFPASSSASSKSTSSASELVPTPRPSSVKDRLTNAFSDARDQIQKIRGEDSKRKKRTPRRTDAEVKQAKEYEARRKKEIQAQLTKKRH